jgi:Transposase
MQLFRELQPRGYTGSYRRVAAYASRLRQAQGLPPRRQGRRQQLPVVAEPASPPLTPRRATWLVLGRNDKRTEAEAQQLAQLHAQSTEVAEAIDLAQDFATLVRQRQPERLDPWLKRAATSPLEALQRFAKGLYEDYNAVKAGVTMPWSNGPVEGHINRLKMLKRQMFGRAHLDLLNRRFLLAPRHERARVSHAEAAAAARAPPAALHPLHQKWVRTKSAFQIPSMLPLLSSPLAYFFFRAFSGRCVTLPRAVGQLSLAPRPRVSNALPPVGVQTRSLPVDIFLLQR